MYIRRPVGYADQYLLRQAESLAGAKLVALLTPEMDFAGEVLFDPTSLSYRLRAKVSNRLRSRSLLTGLDPVASRRVSSALADVRTMYTMFLDNGRDLVGAVQPQRRRLVVHAAGSDVTTLGGMDRGNRRASLRAVAAAEVVLCGSKFIRDQLRTWIDHPNLKVHYIGVPVEPDVRIERDGPFTVLAVSRLHPVKGVHLSIDAFAKAVPRLGDAELVVLGDGPERARLDELVRRRGVAERVHFLGNVPQSDVDAHLGRAHVLVQHNVPLGNGAAEALGGSLLEASARGVPVVATRSGGVPEAVLDRRTGILVEPGDVDGMATALVALYDSEGLRQQLAGEGHRYVSLTHNAGIQDLRLREVLLSH